VVSTPSAPSTIQAGINIASDDRWKQGPGWAKIAAAPFVDKWGDAITNGYAIVEDIKDKVKK